MDNRKYEVFLSFRGEDTRASFISHLYNSLQNAGIIVFKDDESLRWGDIISRSLLHAVEQSQISVVVFSRNYADSRWCLDELEKIMKCQRTIGQVVVPVFYDVDPSEVRHQRGHFGKAFQNLSDRILKEKKEANTLSRWKVLRSKILISERWKELLWKIGISSIVDKEEDIVQRWREALREAAGISGAVVLNST